MYDTVLNGRICAHMSKQKTPKGNMNGAFEAYRTLSKDVSKITSCHAF